MLAALRRIHDGLAAAADLRPGPVVDGLFRELVGLVLTGPPTLLDDPGVAALRPRLVALAARGEYELERAWAARIVAGRRPDETLGHFPYVDNYRLLSRLERRLLPGPAPRRVLFVGAGPLPLSALELAAHLPASVVCVDHDPAAVELAGAVTARLGGGRVTVRLGDASDPDDDLQDFDLVVVAALVGLAPGDKRRVLQGLRAAMAPGALLLARSAHGLRTLLYPALTPPDLDGFDQLSLTHPPAPVINSIVVARRAHSWSAVRS